MRRPTHFRRNICLLGPIFLSLFLVAAVPAADLPANLQLGRIPVLPDGGGWSVAVPLADTDGHWQLTAGASALRLISSSLDGETWLVFEPAEPGPVSALLTLRDPDGRILQRSAVAGEVVSCRTDDLPALLVVTGGRRTVARRYLRMDGLSSPTGVAVPGARAGLGEKRADGWVLLEVEPRPGLPEVSGDLQLGAGGPSIRVQVSAEESITVLAQASLPTGWRYSDLVPLAERLSGRRLRARVGLFGLRSEARVLRLYDLAFDTARGRYSFARTGLSELPSVRETDVFTALGIRLARSNKALGLRQPLLVSLAGERAHLIDPATGLLSTARSAGLRSTGAATASRIHRNAVYSLRSDAGKGEVYLRRWLGRSNEGLPYLRGRMSPRSLQSRFGREQVVPFTMVVRRDASSWPESPVRENLLLLAAVGDDPTASLPVSLYSLRMDSRQPFRIASIRRRYTSETRYRIGDPKPSLDIVQAPTIGSDGYPIGVRIGYDALRTGEIVNLTGLGTPYEGPYYVEGVSHRMQHAGFSLDPGLYLRMDHDGESALMRRYAIVDGRRQVRAAGFLAGVRGLALRSSARRQHAWALTAEGAGGALDPHQLRFLGAGFPEGFNLPPRVDAGADLRSRDGLVTLRARIADPNDEPLSIRWSAPGAEFANPYDPTSAARFPNGVTQVRVRARERSGRYQASDVMYVTVDAASPVAASPALSTALRGLYPNPANPRVRIAFTMGTRGPVRLRVYDVAGRLVRELLNEVRGAGAWDVDWDGLDDAGSTQSSGVYLVRLDTPEGIDQGRVVLLR